MEGDQNHSAGPEAVKILDKPVVWFSLFQIIGSLISRLLFSFIGKAEEEGSEFSLGFCIVCLVGWRTRGKEEKVQCKLAKDSGPLEDRISI